MTLRHPSSTSPRHARTCSRDRSAYERPPASCGAARAARSGRGGVVGLALILAGSLYAGAPQQAAQGQVALAAAPDVKFNQHGRLDSPVGLGWSPNAMAVQVQRSGPVPAAVAVPVAVYPQQPPLLLPAALPAGDAPSLMVSSTHTTAQRPAMAHLPQWVQVTEDGAKLYASADDDASTLTHLAPHTFLLVQGAQGERLTVRLPGDNGTPGAVDPFVVEPAEPGGGWLRVGQPTGLFTSPSGEAGSYRDLGEGTRVRRLGEPSQGRIPVRVYDDGDWHAVGDGWVAAEALADADAPDAMVPLVDDAKDKANPYADDNGAFIDAVAQAALQSKPTTGVPVAVTIAQAILESAWGNSRLTRDANNLFGIKAYGGVGNDGVVWFETDEYDQDGNAYETLAPFRAYKSYADAVLDHDTLFHHSSRYATAMDVREDPIAFAQRIMEGGYSTDPGYADKLVSLMDHYDLYRFDR